MGSKEGTAPAVPECLQEEEGPRTWQNRVKAVPCPQALPPPSLQLCSHSNRAGIRWLHWGWQLQCPCAGGCHVPVPQCPRVRAVAEPQGRWCCAIWLHGHRAASPIPSGRSSARAAQGTVCEQTSGQSLAAAKESKQRSKRARSSAVLSDQHRGPHCSTASGERGTAMQ